MKVAILSLCAVSCFATTTTLTCASTICNGTENALFQTTLDLIGTSINRGDIIELTAGHTWTGNFTITKTPTGTSGVILIRSTATALCPADGVRVTPSQLPNMPTIYNGGNNAAPALSFLGGSTPAAFITVDCINAVGYQASASGGDIFRVGDLTETQTAQLAHDITFKHVLAYGHIGSVVDRTKNGITTAGNNITVQDSFVYEIKSDAESHAIAAENPVGTQTITNNFIEAAALGSLFGGGNGNPYVPNPNPAFTMQYNYFHKPEKWRNDVTGLVIKGMLEFKLAGSAIVKWNTFDNNYMGNDQTGQFTSINARWNGPGFTSPTVNTGTETITISNNGFSNGDRVFTGGAGIPGGLEVCTTSALCYVISAATNTFQLSTTSGGSPINITSSGGSWTLGALESWCGSRNVTYSNNTHRKSLATFSLLSFDANFQTNNPCTVQDATISNNLFYQIGYAYDRTPASTQPVSYGRYVTGGARLSFLHNTTAPSDPQASLPGTAYQMLFDSDPAVVTDTFVYKNNLDPGGTNSFRSGFGSQEDAINNWTSGSSLVQNSTAMGTVSTNWDGCMAPRTCSGMFLPTAAQWDANIMQWTDPANYNYALLSGSPYHNAGTDGADLGADMTTLARVTGLVVTPGVVTATLNYTLSSQISSDPCVLEVSTSDNVIDEDNTYTVINALNPSMFTRQDASNSSTQYSQAGSAATWIIGKNATENDVNGIPRDLRLSASTTYYGRLQCYGDTQTFSFTTGAGGAAGTKISGRVTISGKAVIH